jgi:hypothetical protein
MENGYNPIQLNETVEKAENGTILRTSLMLNIRSENVEEAVKLYTELKDRLSDELDGKKEERRTGLEVETPTCECGAPMIMRQNARKHSLFWGCSRFPKCRKTMEYVGFETAKEIPF